LCRFFCVAKNFVDTREKSPAFKLEYHLSISPGSHKTTNKPRLLSRGKNPKGFVIYQNLNSRLKGMSGTKRSFLECRLSRTKPNKIKKIKGEFLIKDNKKEEINL